MNQVVILMTALLFLLAACQNDAAEGTAAIADPVQAELVGIWIEQNEIDTLMIEFLADNTIHSDDRPLLSEATYHIVDKTTLQFVFPENSVGERPTATLEMELANDVLALTDVSTGEVTVYDRVKRVNNPENFIVASWIGRFNSSIGVTFSRSGDVAMTGVVGLADGSYRFLDNGRLQMQMMGGQVMEFEMIVTANDALILRNELDQSLAFVRE